MFSHDSSHRFLLKALHEAGNEIGALFYTLDEPDLDAREDADSWTLKELLCHMRDAEKDFANQIELILRSRREPHLPSVDVDLYVAERDYAAADLASVGDEYSRLRGHSSYELSALMDEEWDKAGIHPYKGRVTISAIAHEMNEHDLEHLWQIRRILNTAAVR
jgi:hypothetical protein